MKFCKDCKHRLAHPVASFIFGKNHDQCLHPVLQPMRADDTALLVTGKPSKDKASEPPPYAEVQRRYERFCGYAGRYWEKRS